MTTSPASSVRPYRTLTVAFVAWKLFLLAIAAGSQVGATYDTSSDLLTSTLGSDDHDASTFWVAVRHFAARLTSWDAIYFVKSAERGYVFEQEWAFGAALPKMVMLVLRALASLGLVSSDSLTPLIPLTAIVLTNTAHLLSTYALYHLTQQIWSHDATWSLRTAVLHILSPAGLFLSAPYAESPFALLTFTGWLLLAHSCNATTIAKRDALTLLAGVVFGLATTFRTNGLLNGTFFAFDFLRTLYRLVEDADPNSSSLKYLWRLFVLGVSGLCVAAGSFGPQFVAWQWYCTGTETRPWCEGWLPSIYNFVQREYWNTGLLRYWTLPNLPLFLLAAPMLFVLSKSGKDILFFSSSRATERPEHQLLVTSIVASQLVLVLLAFTNYHVQIITRLSSGYPAWYWWVAACLRRPKTQGLGRGLVTFAVMYASIQGVLFASFLPPA